MSGLSCIGDFRNVHEGKRLFILASGPSLSSYDLAPLERRLVMGLNRSFLVYPHGQYHFCMDHRLFYLYPDELKRARFLFTLEGRPWGMPMKLLGSEGFSADPERGVYSGYTVSYVALQLAAYMGFCEVIFLGLDLCSVEGQTHFFGFDFHSRNHDQTEYPKMKRMLEQGAAELGALGVKLFTCSPQTVLPGFSQITFEEALAR